MEETVKIITMYLPQYHETLENDSFWGKGFTDWKSVKAAVPLFSGHQQPKRPLNDNYYDLSDCEAIKIQAELAKQYGVGGFGIYHYWFKNGKTTLTVPTEILLEHSEIEIPFLLAWDNNSWKRTWNNVRGNDWAPLLDDEQNAAEKDKSGVLLEYDIGEESDWKEHFFYLIKFFNDSRYIKDNNKPIFLIYNYEKKCDEMELYWNELAIQAGFDGVELIYRNDVMRQISLSKSIFRYEPMEVAWGGIIERAYWKIRGKSSKVAIKKYDYDKLWQKIINRAEKCHRLNCYYGAFVNYDDSPRRGNRGRLVENSSPYKFYYYMSKLIKISKIQKRKYIFLTAWNEWSEGAYLEPDDSNEYEYLCALKKAIDDNV